MIEFSPFILIVIGWNPDSPAEAMALQHSLHASGELCEKVESEFVTKRDWMKKGNYRVEYRHICIPAPTGEEYKATFKSLREKNE